jgi:hypothetical protein
MDTFLRDILPAPLLQILLFLESWTVRIAVTTPLHRPGTRLLMRT